MPLKLLRRWVGAAASAGHSARPKAELFEEAERLLLADDNQGAIKAYRAYLETDPYNVRALNDLGACLLDTGAVGEGVARLELAYELDDTFVPVMVNYAKALSDNYKRCADALKLLRRAKVGQPDFSHTDAVYAGVLFKEGDGPRATRFQQRAWFAKFDILRLANGALFWGSYDTTEERIAAEHRFWAETLKPLPPLDAPPPAQLPRTGGRIRIGYWSSDFRSHSVRYFFRPVLENHDKERFDIVLFHDCPFQDDQTKLIRDAASEFHDVHEMSDMELRAFFRAQDLDVLVELAGHTSYNRLPLLQDRLARVQINALGYPPTTGLRTLDGKLIDAHIHNDLDHRYYAERPVALPTSFWCYDPMADVELPAPPPSIKNGFVTFGCVGNIAKITAPLLAAWQEILQRVPDARLLIRAINFEDEVALVAMRKRLEERGLPLDRIDLRPPHGPATFHSSYNEIDVILDTFPFNGGTTTCFATYMGVPVVTMAGESLISRMGLSIMTNLGAPELVVGSFEEYVQRAVATAADSAFLERFRREARGRYQATALGNGALFTREFEQACEQLLAEDEAGKPAWEPRLPDLPEPELMRRAYAILRRGQAEAAERVAAYCERAWPESGKPALLKAQLLIWAKAYDRAIEFLLERMDRFPPADRVSALLVLARLQLTLDQRDEARETLDRLLRETVDDAFDRMQADLFAAAAGLHPQAPGAREPLRAEQVLFIVPCDDPVRFAQVQAQVAAACANPPGWNIRFERAEEWQRLIAYDAALRRDGVSMVILLQKNVSIHSASFLVDVQHALESMDLVSCAGALRWTRLDWRQDDFVEKTGSFLTPSSEREGMTELHLFGPGRNVASDGLAVLDGTVLAFRPRAREYPAFNEAHRSAGTLLEEAWSWSCAQQGLRLGVHRNLGVFIDASIELDQSDGTEARVSYALERGFDPFATETEDYLSVSVPVANPARAVAVCGAYLAQPPHLPR